MGFGYDTPPFSPHSKLTWLQLPVSGRLEIAPTDVAERKPDGVPQLVAPVTVANHTVDVEIDIARLHNKAKDETKFRGR